VTEPAEPEVPEVEGVRDWMRRTIKGRAIVDVRGLAEECEGAGVVDAEFRRRAVVDRLSIDARQVLGEVDAEGVRLWVNQIVRGPDGSRQEYKQTALFEKRDYLDALKAYALRIDRLVERRNALAQRAKEKAGVEAGQLRLVVTGVRRTKATAAA
jgi:hypothetical protein